MAVTIKDIARHCGLSVSTVSKVFNNYPDISGATRDQVLKAARELDYRPNALARALKTHRSYSLGALFGDDGLTDPFFAALLNAFRAEAEARGYDIIFISRNIGSTGMSFLEHCRYRNVDGVCLACADFDAPEVKALIDSPIPVCTVAHPFEGRPCVASDDAGGVRALVEHAVGLGHRRIACIHGQPDSPATGARLKAFREAMAALGLSIPEGYVREGRYGDLPSTRDGMRALLSLPDRPTCVLLPDDAAFFGAAEAARSLGLDIPGDMSVAGYGGLRLTQLLNPPLTTVLQDAEGMGRLAARRLIECVEQPDAALRARETVPTRLIEGGTVARL